MSDEFKIRTWNSKGLPQDWFRRGKTLDKLVKKDVESIIAEVRKNGDAALVKFTKKFDNAEVKAANLRVAPEEIQAAQCKVTKAQIRALELMKAKVSSFERANLRQANRSVVTDSDTLQSILTPISSVGCYIPGGQAAYPSTVIMTTVPAKVAGVTRIVVCSPPDEGGNVNPLVLVACDICGVDEVYRVGGVQSIAALAYGTETIMPVCKIVGPGSKYVTTAKVLVSKDVAIDMPAGPSEVLVLADETANAKYVAADMVSQAEHSADSIAGLITTSKKLAEEVVGWLKFMSGPVERGAIVRKALETSGFIIVSATLGEMVELANMFAPEHLEIMTKNPLEVVSRVAAAGLILIGPYSPVALSDYGSGTNHVLPTGGFARSYSGLSIMDFIRRVSIVSYTRDGLQALRNHVKVMTDAENLPNHYKAVEARFEE
jgi:histidinol dehydrogenase